MFCGIPQKTERIGPHIRLIALRSDLDPVLVAAIIWQESKGDPFAVRYEDNFFLNYLRGKNRKKLPGFWPPESVCTEATELRLRATSFGLMQIMGETAREAGFELPYLTCLCDPVINLTVGCQIFAGILKKKDGDTRKALLKWNGGSNKSYPSEVLAHIKAGECQHLLV